MASIVRKSRSESFAWTFFWMNLNVSFFGDLHIKFMEEKLWVFSLSRRGKVTSQKSHIRQQRLNIVGSFMF